MNGAADGQLARALGGRPCRALLGSAVVVHGGSKELKSFVAVVVVGVFQNSIKSEEVENRLGYKLTRVFFFSACFFYKSKSSVGCIVRPLFIFWSL